MVLGPIREPFKGPAVKVSKHSQLHSGTFPMQLGV
jgi:hypothetical protein